MSFFLFYNILNILLVFHACFSVDFLRNYLGIQLGIVTCYIDFDFRKQAPGDNSFGGIPFGAPVTVSNFLYSENGFGFQKASMMQYMTRKFEEVSLDFPLGTCKSSNNVAVRLPSRNRSEIFLQALRDFVSERHGVLEEGWHVEFRRSVNCELYAVYCAPDGKTFDSVYEVACFLGLMSNFNSMEPESRSEGCQSISGRSHLCRKRKQARYSTANGFTENKEGILIFDNRKELSLNGLTVEVCASTAGNNVNGAEVNTSSRSQQYNVSLHVIVLDFLFPAYMIK